MLTMGGDMQREPLTWEEYLDLDEDLRQDIEIVDGYVVPRERRGPDHQKVGFRLAAALEEAAIAEMRRTGGSGCYRTNTEVDVLLWEVPPTARKPDAVLHGCLEGGEFLAAEHVLVVAEVLSTWSGRRDRIHKMGEYAAAGMPHYWLVAFDKVGASTIERYALSRPTGPYTHVATTHRDMGPAAVEATAPFPLTILWEQLEIAPRM